MTEHRDLVMRANLEKALKDPLLVLKMDEIEWLNGADISEINADLSLVDRQRLVREAQAEINRLFNRFNIWTKGL